MSTFTEQSFENLFWQFLQANSYMGMLRYSPSHHNSLHGMGTDLHCAVPGGVV